jgi:hypothetical protein
MHAHGPKAHVSEALVQLQRSVTLCAVVLLLCTLTQLLVFGAAHFTSLRWDTTTKPAEQQPLRVVGADAPGTSITINIAGKVEQITRAPEPAPEPRRLSEMDTLLSTTSTVAVAVGIISSVLLALLTMLGAVIAGASGVPGVSRAVSASSWALLVGVAALPWRDFLPSMPWPGVFGPYSVMTTLSESVDSGGKGLVELLAYFAATPFVVAIMSMVVLLRFRSGIAEGVIVRSMNDLEQKLEEEMEQLRRRGASGQNTVRTVAALNQAIGDRPSDPVAALEPVAAAVSAITAAANSATKPPPPAGGRPGMSEEDIQRMMRPMSAPEQAARPKRLI